MTGKHKGNPSVWAEVDLSAIEHNASAIVSTVSPGTILLAVVKANAYGHGAVEIARTVLAAGFEWLGVARVSEARVLRQAGIVAPILLLSEPDDFGEAVELRLVCTLYSEDGVRALNAAASAAGTPVEVHIKVDTGMHRFGAGSEELDHVMRALDESRYVRPTGVWSHLAVADNPSDPFTGVQIERFLAAVDRLGPRDSLVRHIANSAATLSNPKSHFDLVRIGIALYGIAPSRNLEGILPLRPAMALKARVTHMSDVQAGEALSYGQTYRLERQSRVATVACGYADGYPRALSGRAKVLIGDRLFDVCGTVTMDALMVDSRDEPIERGDVAILIGEQPAVSARRLAELVGTIPYEIVCQIQGRVPRVYFGGRG